MPTDFNLKLNQLMQPVNQSTSQPVNQSTSQPVNLRPKIRVESAIDRLVQFVPPCLEPNNPWQDTNWIHLSHGLLSESVAYYFPSPSHNKLIGELDRSYSLKDYLQGLRERILDFALNRVTNHSQLTQVSHFHGYSCFL